MAKKAGIYEIRSGVYAYGVPGERAKAVVSRFKGTGKYQGVRGIKPTIADHHKEVTVVKEAQETIARLSGGSK